MAAVFPGAVVTQAQLWTAVNGISTTLNGAIDSVTGTVTVIDTTNFPATGYFIVDQEIVKYSGKTGTTFTGCTRGADGSTAAAHTDTSIAAAYIVADHHNIVTLEIVAIETVLGSNAQHMDLTGRPGLGIKLKSSGGVTIIIGAVDDGGGGANLGIIG